MAGEVVGVAASMTAVRTGAVMDGVVTTAGSFDGVLVGTGVVFCVAGDVPVARSSTGLSVTACGAGSVGVEPVSPLESAAAVPGVGVEVLWSLPGCVEPVEVVTGVLAVGAAVAAVVPEPVVAPEVPLLRVDRVRAAEALFGTSWEPLEPVLPEVAALASVLIEPRTELVVAVVPLVEAAEPAELLLWLLPPADGAEPLAWELSAWASPEPLASAAPTPSVTTPADSQVHARLRG